MIYIYILHTLRGSYETWLAGTSAIYFDDFPSDSEVSPYFLRGFPASHI
jgi:hypothetical protein